MREVICLVTSALVLVVSSLQVAYGEDFLITVTSGAKPPAIDGGWSHEKEWKQSSERIIGYEDGGKLVLRGVHDRESMYILLDMLSDITENRYRDQAWVCFDTKNNGSEKLDSDDYCFVAALGSNSFITYKGGGSFGVNSYLEKVENPAGMEAKAGISGEMDRYAQVRHLSYEFKIPIEFLTRSDVYGFYVGILDGSSNIVYSWPVSKFHGDYPYVKPPSEWGKIVSPDRSIPEFSTAMSVAVLAGLVLVVIIFNKRIKTIGR